MCIDFRKAAILQGQKHTSINMLANQRIPYDIHIQVKTVSEHVLELKHDDLVPWNEVMLPWPVVH